MKDSKKFSFPNIFIAIDMKSFYASVECVERGLDPLKANLLVADESRSDVWVEDSAIVMANMHLMASAIGVGSCWIQGRLREAIDGESTEDYLRCLLQFPSECRLEAILSLGIPDEEFPAKAPESLPFEKVHINKY